MASIACVRVSKHRAAGRSNAITARMRHKRSVTIPKWLPNIGAADSQSMSIPVLGKRTWAKNLGAATVDAVRSNCISTCSIFQIEKLEKRARICVRWRIILQKRMQTKFLNYPSFQAQG
jgi:hypothetical protein